MTDTIFDAFSRNLARQQAAAAPVTAEARKRKKNKKNNKTNGDQEKIFARCTSQLPACQAFAQTTCADDAACVAAVTTCCNFMGACDFTSFIGCFLNATAP